MTHAITDESGDSVPVRVAGEILRRYGADPATARRGHGWTNATWLTEEWVVRVARAPDTADLLREERLLRLLPAEVGCPPVVDAGVRHGYAWVLTRRVPGTNLEEVWPTLDDAERAGAVEQMWERAGHVHAVDAEAAAPYARARSPFFPESPAAATAAVARLVAAGELTSADAKGLGRVLDRFWAALPGARRVLNHGDFCVPNALWHDGRVTALLDFEFAVVAPLAVDLNELVKTGFALGGSGEGPVRDTVRRLAAPALDAAGGPDVLLGYAVMLETWMLERALAPDDPDEDDRAHSTAMLTAFAEGDGGHFAPLLDELR